MRTNRLIVVALLAGLAGGGGGCVSPENDTLLIGQATRLETFAPTPGPEIDLGRGTERSGWPRVVVLAPVHSTIHRPTYAPLHQINASTARARNEMATVGSATERCGESDPSIDSAYEDRQAVECVRAHLMGVVDLVMIVPRMVLEEGPGVAVRSPDEPYRRDWIPPEVIESPDPAQADEPQP